MPTDTLVLGLIGGSLLASFVYIYSTSRKTNVEEDQNFLSQQGGPDAWLKETNVQYIPKDQVLLNALDSLAVYRYVDNIQFYKIINEIELFYAMFIYVMSSKIGRGQPQINSTWRTLCH